MVESASIVSDVSSEHIEITLRVWLGNWHTNMSMICGVSLYCPLRYRI